MRPNYAQSSILYVYYSLIFSKKKSKTQNYFIKDNQYQGAFAARYRVDVDELSFANLTTSLTIKNVLLSDSMYAYECECNIYRTCSNGAIAKASAVLIALTTS